MGLRSKISGVDICLLNVKVRNSSKQSLPAPVIWYLIDAWFKSYFGAKSPNFFSLSPTGLDRGLLLLALNNCPRLVIKDIGVARRLTLFQAFEGPCSLLSPARGQTVGINSDNSGVLMGNSKGTPPSNCDVIVHHSVSQWTLSHGSVSPSLHLFSLLNVWTHVTCAVLVQQRTDKLWRCYLLVYVLLLAVIIVTFT